MSVADFISRLPVGAARLVRESAAMATEPLVATEPPRMLWMRATVRSASCSSLSASTTRTGSPSPSSENSVLGNSLGFGPMTLLAARRMAPVER